MFSHKVHCGVCWGTSSCLDSFPAHHLNLNKFWWNANISLLTETSQGEPALFLPQAVKATSVVNFISFLFLTTVGNICCFCHNWKGKRASSCIDEFRKKILAMCERYNDMFTFICGDFNIDLLQYNKHNKTTEFVNMMFGLGFFH